MPKAMHHLIGRDVVQHEANCLDRINASRNRSEFIFREADELGVATMNGQCRNQFTEHRMGRTLSSFIYDPHNVPSWREWQGRFFWMDSLPHQ